MKKFTQNHYNFMLSFFKKRDWQKFLLSFFDGPHDSFKLMGINGFVLVRTINGATGEPLVLIYTQDSFNNSQVSLDHEEPEQKKVSILDFLDTLG